MKEKGLKWTLQVTYEKWRYKSNPKYPSAHKVIKKFDGFLCAEIQSIIKKLQVKQLLQITCCIKLPRRYSNKKYVSIYLAHKKGYQSEHQEKTVAMSNHIYQIH